MASAVPPPTVKIMNANVTTAAAVQPRCAEYRRSRLDSAEVFVEYQPIISLITGQVVSAEALARLRIADIVIYPDGFIPLAINTGFIDTVTSAVLKAATSATASEDVGGLSISLNVSVEQIADERWLERTLADMDSTDRIVWEITESEHSEDADISAAVDAIHAAGMTVAMDDFGSGGSGLQRLASAPFDFVKFDRSLVSPIEESKRHRATIETMSNLAFDLGAAVICEGVETEAQANILLDLGCSLAQGWLFGRPGSRQALIDLCRNGRSF